MGEKKEFLTITLTGREPVKIRLDDWPIIAEADAYDYDNQYEFQANRKSKHTLKVRQHEDGRAIVYGFMDYDTKFQNESGFAARGGELLGPGDSIPEAIKRVAGELEERMPTDDGYSAGVFPRLAHECTADLPAVEI
jgi:hypothetical protein